MFLVRFNARDIDGCLLRTVYMKVSEDIGDNVSTSVEFVVVICFVEWQCGHIYVKKMFGFLTDGLVSGVLMLLGNESERPTWYWLMVLILY